MAHSHSQSRLGGTGRALGGVRRASCPSPQELAMTDDLLKGLGRAVREEEAKGERLDALAERLRSTPAQASSPEAKSLDAAALGVDEDAVRAAYAPLSAEQKARLASQLAERIRATAGHASEGARAQPLPRPRASGSKVWLAGGA